MINFYSFSGNVKNISDFITGQNGEREGCYKLISVEGRAGESVNFVVSPDTYFVDPVTVSVGDFVTGYYDGNAPVPLIYPPQYRALIMVKESPYQNVKVDFFNSQFLSRDGQLKLNIAPYTQIVLRNAQAFTKNPSNRNLIVVYGPTTKSLPPQTTPYKIIVWC